MRFTFDDILEKVVYSTRMSRKEKLNELRKFLKEYSGGTKPLTEKEAEILATLKNIKQSYTVMENNEKIKDKLNK